jgi:hypothetical protein
VDHDARRSTALRHHRAVGEDAFRRVNEPIEVDGQRGSGLRFADLTVQALFSALLVFRLLPRGFSARDLRDHWAPLVGKAPANMTSGQMTYHLRRLRLHGLIERIPETHRYRVTREGAHRAVLDPASITGSCVPAWRRSFPRKPRTIRSYTERLIRPMRRSINRRYRE